MPTRRIAKLPPPPCMHPEHNPPNMRVFEPGVYEHECPSCGFAQRFVVSRPYSFNDVNPGIPSWL